MRGYIALTALGRAALALGASSQSADPSRSSLILSSHLFAVTSPLTHSLSGASPLARLHSSPNKPWPAVAATMIPWM